VLRAQFLFHTCHCQYPGTAVECIFHSLPLRWQPSPHRLAGRPVHHPFRGVLSIHSRCGLRVRQDTNVSLYTRGSSQFVTSLTAPVASGRSESDRVGFAPTGKAPPLHGARRSREVKAAIRSSGMLRPRHVELTLRGRTMQRIQCPHFRDQPENRAILRRSLLLR